MIAKILLAAAAVCLCPLSTSAAAAALEVAAPSTVGIAAERLEQIGSALRAEVAQGAIPGALVAIARRGKLVYHEAFGFLDRSEEHTSELQSLRWQS